MPVVASSMSSSKEAGYAAPMNQKRRGSAPKKPSFKRTQFGVLLLAATLVACAEHSGAGEPGARVPEASPPVTAPAVQAPSAPPAPAVAPPASAPAADIAFKVLPFKGTWKGQPISVTADGKIVVGGKEHAHFSGADVQDQKGTVLIHSTDSSAIKALPPEQSVMKDPQDARFDEHDSLITNRGGQLVVGDDGAVSMLNNGKMVRGPMTVEGFAPTMKREIIFVFLVLMRDF